MFHLTERIAIWPGYKGAFEPPFKSIASRRFYAHGEDRYGLFHSMGVTASYGVIVEFLNRRFDISPLRKLKLLREFTRIPALAAVKIFGAAQMYSTLIEDFPYAENRVLFDPENPDKIAFEYTVHDELKERRKRFRKLLKKTLSPTKLLFLGGEHVLELGHPSGTARFGDDPATSVLNLSCRAHNIDNLYVADSSFMPTSGGVNPSLMIAANALRVGDLMAEERAHL